MRALRVLVVVMGVLIVVGMVAMVLVLSQRLSAPPPRMTPILLDEPAGTRIAGATLSGDQLVVQLQGGGPDRIVMLEPSTGRIIGQIGLAR